MSKKESAQRAYEAHEREQWPDQPRPWHELHASERVAWVRAAAAVEAPLLAENAQLNARIALLEKERSEIVTKLGEALELAGEMMPHVDEYFRAKWGYGPALTTLKTYHASLTQAEARALPPGLPLRVYVAGGSSERLLVQRWIDELVRQGIKVTLDWTRDPAWDLGRTPTHEELAAIAAREEEAIDAAHMVWRLVPVAKSEGSAHEGGYASAKGKLRIVSGEVGARNVFELLPDVLRFATHEEAAAHIVSLAMRGKIGPCLHGVDTKREQLEPLYQCTPCLAWQEPEHGGRCRACGGAKAEHEGRA